MGTRTDARASLTGHPHTLWFAAGSATAAVTGGLLAAVDIASVMGWSLEGKAPASGWLGNTIVALTDSALWLRVRVVAGALIPVS